MNVWHEIKCASLVGGECNCAPKDLHADCRAQLAEARREREADRAAISYLNRVLDVYHSRAGCGNEYGTGPDPECAGCTARKLFAAAIQRASQP